MRFVHLVVNLDSPQYQHGVLRDAVFSEWQDNATSDDLQSPEELQKKDPLGIQIWKLYSKTKSQLPNRERMDNLSWRMMSMNLKKAQRERSRLSKNGKHAPTSQPSGISQLRRSFDQHSTQDGEVWNLDDFIIPTSVASPAGLSRTSSGEDTLTAKAPAIPIRKHKPVPEQDLDPSIASAPSKPPFKDPSHTEFDYVQRLVRKTSVDERRSRKRPAEQSPQVLPIHNVSNLHDQHAGANLNNYTFDPLHDQTAFHGASDIHHHFPLSLNTFDLDNDPIIHSAPPYQKRFNLSPESPLVQSNPYSQGYNVSLGQTVTSVNFTSPSGPGSAFASRSSTPHDRERMFFPGSVDMSHPQQIPFGQPRPSHVSHNAMQPSQMLNPGYNPMYDHRTSTGPPPPFQAHFNNISNHVNPTHIHTDDSSMMRHDNMFSLPEDSDNEDETIAAFAEQNFGISEDLSAMDNVTMGNHWDPDHDNRRNTAGTAYGGATNGYNFSHDAGFVNHDWNTGGSLGRSHGSTASVSEFRNRVNDPRMQKVPRTTSTPNAVGLMHQNSLASGLETSPNSPGDSALQTAESSRPASPGGLKGGDAGGVPTTCTNCFTQTTPLWRRDPGGNPLCNACGLFLKLHGVVRPLSLKTDVIKKRHRGSGNAPPTNARAKMKSRKNSIVQPVMTAPLRTNESESPLSQSGSAGSGHTNNSGMSRGSNVPIAPGPPKPSTGPPPAAGLVTTPTKAMATPSSKRGKRQKASISNPSRDTNMANSEDTSGASASWNSKAPTKPTRPPGTAPIPATKDWEWLTMSL
ncbi:MAG: hypothetical protein M1828_002641 [Chrysothrix sp. TS-e1954]|nr:MAG: hypothetical protein M1828_002641 [Chrysothrix sp. TS-e1954]